jgi:hypothetical protein
MLVKCVSCRDFFADQFCVCLVRRSPRPLLRLAALRCGRQSQMRPPRRLGGLLFCGQVSPRPPGSVVYGFLGGVDAHTQDLALRERPAISQALPCSKGNDILLLPARNQHDTPDG